MCFKAKISCQYLLLSTGSPWKSTNMIATLTKKMLNKLYRLTSRKNFLAQFRCCLLQSDHCSRPLRRWLWGDKSMQYWIMYEHSCLHWNDWHAGTVSVLLSRDICYKEYQAQPDDTSIKNINTYLMIVVCALAKVFPPKVYTLSILFRNIKSNTRADSSIFATCTLDTRRKVYTLVYDFRIGPNPIQVRLWKYVVS